MRPLTAPTRPMRIGEVARACGLTRRAIRFYEARGLITQIERDDQDGRLYSAEVVDELEDIALARRADLSLKDVAEMCRVGQEGGKAARRARLAELCRARAASLVEEQRRLAEIIEEVAGGRALRAVAGTR